MSWALRDGSTGPAGLSVHVDQPARKIRLWTASSSDREFNFDFNVSLTEEQQREGAIEYNYRRESQWREPSSEGTAALHAAMAGTDAATAVNPA